MDLIYERTENFDGEPSKAIEIVQNTLLPHGFEIVKNAESYFEVFMSKFNLFTSGKQNINPIKLISKASVSIDNGEITLYAELNGVKKFILYASLFILSMAVFFLVTFGIVFTQKLHLPMSKIALLSLAPLTPWPFLIPLMGVWYKNNAIKALDTLMNNMLSVSKAPRIDEYTERKSTNQMPLIVLTIIGIAVLNVLLILWITGKFNPSLNMYEEFDGQTVEFITEQYRDIVSKANERNIYANCHIYYINDKYLSCHGGMGYFHNTAGTISTGSVRLSGTSYLKQTFFDTSMQKLNVEFRQDQQRSNLYHVYFSPSKPIEAGEVFYYLWNINESEKLNSGLSKKAPLTMQNHPGSHLIETFFLVLPKDLRISESSSPTASKELDKFNVYQWTKEVMPDENHREIVVVTK
jgi:hypothetical protein